MVSRDQIQDVFAQRFPDKEMVDFGREAGESHYAMQDAAVEAADVPLVSYSLDVPPIYVCDSEPEELSAIDDYLVAVSPDEKHVYIDDQAMESKARDAGAAWEEAMEDQNLYMSLGISESGVTYSVTRRYDMTPLSFEEPSQDRLAEAVDAVDWGAIPEEGRRNTCLFLADMKSGMFLDLYDADERNMLAFVDLLREAGGFVAYQEEIEGMKSPVYSIKATKDDAWVEAGVIDLPSENDANGRFLGYPDEAIESFEDGETILADRAVEEYGDGEELSWIEFAVPDSHSGYEQIRQLDERREHEVNRVAVDHEIGIEQILEPGQTESNAFNSEKR